MDFCVPINLGKLETVTGPYNALLYLYMLKSGLHQWQKFTRNSLKKQTASCSKLRFWLANFSAEILFCRQLTCAPNSRVFIDAFRAWHFTVILLEVPVREEQFFLVFSAVAMQCVLQSRAKDKYRKYTSEPPVLYRITEWFGFAQSSIQPGLQHFQGRGFHSFSGHSSSASSPS